MKYILLAMLVLSTPAYAQSVTLPVDLVQQAVVVLGSGGTFDEGRFLSAQIAKAANADLAKQKEDEKAKRDAPLTKEESPARAP